MIDKTVLLYFIWYLVFGVLLRHKAVQKFLKKIGMGEEALMLFMSKLLLIIGFGGFFVYWLTNSSHN